MNPGRGTAPLGAGADRDRVALGISLGIMLTALAVITGWHAHVLALIRILPGTIAMQYNTALCFLALGAAGASLAAERRWLFLVTGLFVVLMGGAVIVEYATGRSFGIDTFFFDPWEHALSANPGRMALTTAISFFLAGVALIALAIHSRAHAVFAIVNSIPLSLALTSIVGYAFNITYILPFNLGTQMALLTSMAMFAYGIATLGHAWKHAKRGPDGLPRWGAGIGVAFLPVLLVGASAFFPRQTWRIGALEVLVSIVGVGIIIFGVLRLTTAKVAYKGLLMIATPLVLLLVFVGLVVHVKNESESAQEWSEHSTEVLAVTQTLLTNINESESAARGYVITGDQALVEAYEGSSARVKRTATRLRELVVDNSAQEAAVADIGRLTAQRMARLSEVVQLTSEGKSSTDPGTGAALMQQVRAGIGAFTQEEERLGLERRQLLATSWQRLSWLLVAGTAAAILLAAILTLSFSGGISRRLEQLRDNAVSLAAGQALAPHLTGNDEIADLDRVFHDMAESLDQVTRREKANRILESHIVEVEHTEALRKTGALQSAIFNSANFSSIATDAKGVIQIFNVGAERMLGYAAAEVTDKVTPADISDPREVIARAEALSLEFGTPIKPGFEALVFKASRGIEDIYELTYFRKDGAPLPAVVSVTALRDVHEAIIGYLLIGTDNTARKQAEGALQKANALQGAISNNANFSSIATDAKGVIQIFNVGAERMFGYEAADVIGKITPADLHDSQEVVARARALSLEFGTPIAPGFEAVSFKASRGIEDVYEVTKVRKDGSRFPALVSVTALRDVHDAIIGYLLIGTDNTVRQQIEEERKKLEQHLRDEKFYTRSLIESNIDALMTTDPHGIITDVNKQTETLTGSTRDELIGAPFKDCFTDPMLAELGIERVLNEGKVTNYELTARARDGTLTVVSYNATTFHDRDRNLQGVFAAARDVTDLKRIEQTLQRKNVELEDASRMKSEFLANMSHELRTPLNAIIGFSELMRDGVIGELSDQQRTFVTDICSSGKHLLSLINEILDLSKVEAGKMALDLEQMDLSALFVSSLSVIKEKAAAHRVRMRMEVADELTSMQADARKVKQILYNLVSNAVKFSIEGGEVTLHASRVPRAEVGRLSGVWEGLSLPLAPNEFEEFLEISVTDDGIGVSPEGLKKLFQPFSQVESGLARNFEGTGLGLVMVKLLAELHGGTVAAESAVGQGSRFTVWLPLREPGKEALASAMALTGLRSRPAAGEQRIALVVEDDFKSAELIRVQLEAEGFKVLHASTAETALAMAAEQPLSLITLDILLPNMDGWEFLARIKRLPEVARVPVVIISIVADRKQGFALGAVAVMEKPISRQELYESLVDLGLFPLSQGQTLRVLIVDDDPKAVELIALRILDLATTVLRAYGGRDAIEVARRELPDLIVLDLMMPDVSGFDVVTALIESPDTARIPVLVVTAKQITHEDRATLNGYVTAIMEKATFDNDRFAIEIRRALSGRNAVAV